MLKHFLAKALRGYNRDTDPAAAEFLATATILALATNLADGLLLYPSVLMALPGLEEDVQVMLGAIPLSTVEQELGQAGGYG